MGTATAVFALALVTALSPARPMVAADGADANERAGAPAGPRPWRAAPDALVRALRPLGVAPEQFRIDAGDMSWYGGGIYRQQMWEAFLSDPLRIERDVEAIRTVLLASPPKGSELVSFATIRLREGVRRGLIRSPLLPARRSVPEADAMARAIEALVARGGRPRTPAESAALRQAAAAVPDAVTKPVALLLSVLPSVLEWRDDAFREVPPDERRELCRELPRLALEEEGSGASFARTARSLAERTDFPALYAGAADLALAVDAALDGLPETVSEAASRAGGSARLPAIPGLRLLSNRSKETAIVGERPGFTEGGGTDASAQGRAQVVEESRREGPPSPTQEAQRADPAGHESVATQRALRFRAVTPYGDVVIAGDGDDIHAGPALLIVDTGGNDTYGSVKPSCDGGLAIVIDLGGRDAYVSDQGADWSRAATRSRLAASPGDRTPAKGAIREPVAASSAGRPRGAKPGARHEEPTAGWGCGVMGYGFVADLSGDDVHDSPGLSQGFGLFGVGLVVDEAGNDRYRAGVLAQGAAVFGAGILADLAGSDQYTCEQRAQGYGFTRGLGLLLDRAGNDTYVADDVRIRFPSAQSPQHNTSLAQGCGHGRRADFSDGLSLAGGIGLLLDGEGDDRYAAGVFAQGAGYWYGTGVLHDASGDDRYEGAWYVQGSAAHFAAGVLLDASGRDVYRASLNMAQGAGHDFSWGQLVDGAGDDRYEAPNLSLGGGNDNGIGWLWDRGGDDDYRVSGESSLGRATISAPRGGLRDGMLCLGLFMDTGGGRDSYTAPFARNGTRWVQPGFDPSSTLEAEKGGGCDE